MANRMAAVVSEDSGAFTMGSLFGKLGGELTRQNVSDITEALIEEGMDERTARKNARILWYVVKNGPVSGAQAQMIEGNDILAKVMREVIIDPYCTVDPQSIGYNEILRRLARETVARESRYRFGTGNPSPTGSTAGGAGWGIWMPQGGDTSSAPAGHLLLEEKAWGVPDKTVGQRQAKNAVDVNKGVDTTQARLFADSEYEAWLDHLASGGTTKDWEKRKKTVEKSSQSSKMKYGLQFFAKSSKDYKAIQLPKQEYAHVMSELATHLTEAQRKQKVITKAIGNYIYTVENNGFGDYRVIGKEAIDKDISDWWDD